MRYKQFDRLLAVEVTESSRRRANAETAFKEPAVDLPISSTLPAANVGKLFKNEE